MEADKELEVELCYWRDHEGYMWRKKEDAANYFDGRWYTLRPVYSVGIIEEFNGP